MSIGFTKKIYLLVAFSVTILYNEVERGDYMTTNIGSRIKARRVELGYTQEELATKMGYKSKTAINKIELGINDVSQSKVIRFAEALHTTPAYLMGWEKEPEDLADLAATILQDKDLLGMIEQYLTMDAADQRAMRAMADALAAKKG